MSRRLELSITSEPSRTPEWGKTPEPAANIGIEAREALPYSGLDVVIVGGTGGTGLAAGIEFRKLGARVALVGRSESHFNGAKVAFRRAGVDTTTGVYHMACDIADHNGLDRAVQALKEDDSGEKKEKKFTPQVVILAAATGMQFSPQLVNNFLIPMNNTLAQDPEHAAEINKKKSEELNSQLDIWLPQYYEESKAVNFDAQVDAVRTFSQYFPEDFALISWNSTFGYLGKGPRFYGNVLTKHLFTQWLHENAADLARNNHIDSAEITISVIEDTPVGKNILERINPLYPTDVAEVIDRTKVRRIDAVNATRQFIDMPPELRATEDRPFELFVTGDNGLVRVTRTLPRELDFDLARLPF